MRCLRSVLSLSIALAAFTLVLSLSSQGPCEGAEAATFVVPTDFSTIQDALDNASNGDTIRVHAGTHFSSPEPDHKGMIVVQKSVTIVGNGTDETIIFGNLTVLCLRVVSGITLRGLHISGNGTGILIDYASGSVLEDLLVTSNGTGLNIEHADGNRISNSTFICGSCGVAVTHQSNDNVFFNVACRSASTGLGISGICKASVRNMFVDCTFDGNGLGASLSDDTEDCTFLRCSFDDNIGSGIRLRGSGHVLESCTAEGNGGDGMELLSTRTSGHSVLNCTIWSNEGRGISVQDAYGCRLENLSISRNAIGIGAFRSGLTLLGCDIVMNDQGGMFENTTMVQVGDCNISDNRGDGVAFLNYSYTSHVCNCSLVGNLGDGIVVRGADGTYRPYLTIRDNLILRSGAAGMRLDHASNVTVIGNTIQGSTGCAIITPSIGESNLIHLNLFLNNTAHIASPQECDRYDNGSMGNYWDDYLERYPNARIVGLVWDTPYEVVKGSGVFDHYPLVFMREFKPPVADAGPDRTAPHGSVLTLDGSNSTDESPIIEYRWTIEGPDGKRSVLASPDPLSQLTFLVLGEHNITLTVTDVWGNKASDALTITVLDLTPPLVDAGEDMTVGINEVFTLEPGAALDLVGIVRYEWTVDPGGSNLTRVGRAVEHSFASLGDFMVVLRVWDGSGNGGEDALTVRVVDRVPPACDAGPDLVVDQGEGVLLDGTGSTDNVGVVDWNWSFDYDGEAVCVPGAEAHFVFHLPGTYTVTLTVRDGSGNGATDMMDVKVIDTERPVAEAGPDREVPQGHPVDLDGGASTDNTGIVGYRWTFRYLGEDRSLDGPTVEFMLEEPGVYAVTLEVRDGAGNTAMDSLVVRVLDAEPPRAVADGPGTIEIGGRAVLHGNRSSDNVGIVDHRWTFQYRGKEVVLSGAHAEHLFEAPGSYEITLTVTDAEGNSDTDTIILTVTPVEHTFGGLNLWVLLGIIAAFIIAVALARRRDRAW